MKVCFIIEYYYPHIGGAEILFQNLAEGLVNAGHSCEVVTCKIVGSPREETINRVHIRRVWVPSKGDRYWFTFLSLPSAFKYAKNADIVQTTTYNGAPPAWIISKILKKPSVIFVHEVLGKNWYKTGLKPIMAWIYRLFEALVLKLPFDIYMCNSNSTLNNLKNSGASADKTKMTYLGIDYGLFDPRKDKRKEIRESLKIDENTFVYLFFGRPGYVKGLEYLIRAAPQIKKNIPNSLLLMLLSHEPAKERRKMLALIEELNLKQNKDILIMDPVKREDLPYYIKASDCVVIPSISEGFGFTCAESCAMDVPAVVTNAGSLPEVVSGKYVMVTAGSPDALSDGVEKIYKKDYTTSEKKIFAWENLVKKHIEIYEELKGKMREKKQ